MTTDVAAPSCKPGSKRLRSKLYQHASAAVRLLCVRGQALGHATGCAEGIRGRRASISANELSSIIIALVTVSSCDQRTHRVLLRLCLQAKLGRSPDTCTQLFQAKQHSMHARGRKTARFTRPQKVESAWKLVQGNQLSCNPGYCVYMQHIVISHRTDGSASHCCSQHGRSLPPTAFCSAAMPNITHNSLLSCLRDAQEA